MRIYPQHHVLIPLPCPGRFLRRGVIAASDTGPRRPARPSPLTPRSRSSPRPTPRSWTGTWWSCPSAPAVLGQDQLQIFFIPEVPLLFWFSVKNFYILLWPDEESV
jgi:hypothetical protein